MENKKLKPPVTRALLETSYQAKSAAIQARLAEFAQISAQADDQRLFEELVFCIFTAGASAKMGLKAIEHVRPVLQQGSEAEISAAIQGVHRYGRARAGYIVHTRNYLVADCQLKLSQRLLTLADPEQRRDFFAANQGIKGIGYKEASHYLRNIGYRGYAILDKHILRSLKELGVIDSDKPPTTKRRYQGIEVQMQQFAQELGIDFDELDLLLWSNKTGEILK